MIFLFYMLCRIIIFTKTDAKLHIFFVNVQYYKEKFNITKKNLILQRKICNFAYHFNIIDIFRSKRKQ